MASFSLREKYRFLKLESDKRVVFILQISFNDLGDYLRHGREIEFRYEGKDYSITNCHYEWQFCCDTDGTTIKLCAFHEFDVLVEKIRCLEIDGISIEDIFDKSFGDLDVLDIL